MNPPQLTPQAAGLDPAGLPQHVAVIMDGNGRWAKQRGLPRVQGHRAGMNTVRRVIRACGELGIPFLTLYAFSTENWKRPAAEVSFLMNLLLEFLRRELKEMNRQGVRLRRLGRRDRVPPRVLAQIDRAVKSTAHNQGLQVNLAFNYGGRREILDAVKKAAKARTPLTEESFGRHLYTAGLPDPDLLIRTSGEYRISNFLLWQLAYAEIVVSPVLWPDFGERELVAALAEYQRRERRFGGVEAVRLPQTVKRHA
ncbi:MAG: isoprenyl transferase [candidate division FCPU426 bacterium]